MAERDSMEHESLEHERIKEQLSLLVDGCLSDDKKDALLSHVAGCDECSSLLKVYTAVHKLMRDDALSGPDFLNFADGNLSGDLPGDLSGENELIDPPEELVNSVMEKVRAVKASQRRKRIYVSALAAAACFAVLMTGVTLLGKSGGSAVPKDAAMYAAVEEAEGVEARDYILSNGDEELKDNGLSGAGEADEAAQDGADDKMGGGSFDNDGSVADLTQGASIYCERYETAEELAKAYFGAIVYAGIFPEELDEAAAREVYYFSDGTVAAVIDSAELEELTKAGYDVTVYDSNGECALLVYTP